MSLPFGEISPNLVKCPGEIPLQFEGTLAFAGGKSIFQREKPAGIWSWCEIKSEFSSPSASGTSAAARSYELVWKGLPEAVRTEDDWGMSFYFKLKPELWVKAVKTKFIWGWAQGQ